MITEAEQEKKAPATISTKALEKWLMEQDDFFSTWLELKPDTKDEKGVEMAAIILSKLSYRFMLTEDYKLSAWRYAPEDSQ